jgi:hypothetical protein
LDDAFSVPHHNPVTFKQGKGFHVLSIYSLITIIWEQEQAGAST